MQKVFRIIKRRRNLRRLSVVWLFLLTIELFCPAFCDDSDFRTENYPPKSQITASIESEKAESSETSVSICDNQNSGDHNKTVCNDECLCHAVAIPSLNTVDLKNSVVHSEKIAVHLSQPIFNSLPPPFLPPKNS